MMILNRIALSPPRVEPISATVVSPAWSLTISPLERSTDPTSLVGHRITRTPPCESLSTYGDSVSHGAGKYDMSRDVCRERAQRALWRLGSERESDGV